MALLSLNSDTLIMAALKKKTTLVQLKFLFLSIRAQIEFLKNPAIQQTFPITPDYPSLSQQLPLKITQ